VPRHPPRRSPSSRCSPCSARRAGEHLRTTLVLPFGASALGTFLKLRQALLGAGRLCRGPRASTAPASAHRLRAAQADDHYAGVVVPVLVRVPLQQYFSRW
jgi:hypothetical protein